LATGFNQPATHQALPNRLISVQPYRRDNPEPRMLVRVIALALPVPNPAVQVCGYRRLGQFDPPRRSGDYFVYARSHGSGSLLSFLILLKKSIIDFTRRLIYSDLQRLGYYLPLSVANRLWF